MLFGVTVDQLLGKASPILQAAADHQLEEFLGNNKVNIETLAEAVPVLKPEQADTIFKCACLDDDDPVILQQFAPFISTALLDEIAEKRFAEGKTVTCVVPFISNDALIRIAKVCYQRNGLKGLAETDLLPFLPYTCLESIALQAFEDHGLSGIEYAAPFLSEGFLSELAEKAIEKDGIRAIIPIAPFLSQSLLSKYIKERYL